MPETLQTEAWDDLGHYFYRTAEGRIFRTQEKTLELAQEQKDAWLAQGTAPATAKPEKWIVKKSYPDAVLDQTFCCWIETDYGTAIARVYGPTPKIAHERALVMAAAPEMLELCMAYLPAQRMNMLNQLITGAAQ